MRLNCQRKNEHKKLHNNTHKRIKEDHENAKTHACYNLPPPNSPRTYEHTNKRRERERVRMIKWQAIHDKRWDERGREGGGGGVPPITQKQIAHTLTSRWYTQRFTPHTAPHTVPHAMALVIHTIPLTKPHVMIHTHNPRRMTHR